MKLVKQKKSYIYSLKEDEQEFINLTQEINKEELWYIPEPSKLMTVKTYQHKLIKPFIKRLRKIVDIVVTQYNKLFREVKQLRKEVFSLKQYINPLEDEVILLRNENRKFRNQLSKLSKNLGKD